MISTQLVIVQLLAGDIEVNPGPHQRSTPLALQKKQQCQQIVALNTLPSGHCQIACLTHLCLVAVGPVEFPRLGLLRASGPAVRHLFLVRRGRVVG